MAKKRFANPFIVAGGFTPPGDDNIEVGGSGQGGIDYPVPTTEPVPVPTTDPNTITSYDLWESSEYYAEYDGVEGIDFSDYVEWCLQNGVHPDGGLG